MKIFWIGISLLTTECGLFYLSGELARLLKLSGDLLFAGFMFISFHWSVGIYAYYNDQLIITWIQSYCN